MYHHIHIHVTSQPYCFYNTQVSLLSLSIKYYMFITLNMLELNNFNVQCALVNAIAVYFLHTFQLLSSVNEMNMH